METLETLNKRMSKLRPVNCVCLASENAIGTAKPTASIVDNEACQMLNQITFFKYVL